MVYVHVTYEHASAVHRSHGEMLDSIVPPLEKQRHELRDLINKSLKVTLPLIRSHTHTHTHTHTQPHTQSTFVGNVSNRRSDEVEERRPPIVRFSICIIPGVNNKLSHGTPRTNDT